MNDVEIKQWMKDTEIDLRSSITQMGVIDKGNLLRSIRSGSFTKKNITYRVGFEFERYGAFVVRGAGKGYKVRNGYPHKNKQGIERRYPRDWYDPVIEKNIGSLADIIRNRYANACVSIVRFN